MPSPILDCITTYSLFPGGGRARLTTTWQGGHWWLIDSAGGVKNWDLKTNSNSFVLDLLWNAL